MADDPTRLTECGGIFGKGPPPAREGTDIQCPFCGKDTEVGAAHYCRGGVAVVIHNDYQADVTVTDRSADADVAIVKWEALAEMSRTISAQADQIVELAKLVKG